jgi:hypothetical protein
MDSSNGSSASAQRVDSSADDITRLGAESPTSVMPSQAPAGDLEDSSSVEMDETFQEIMDMLETKGLGPYENILTTLHHMFQVRRLLENFGFDESEILRHFKLLIKVHSPDPPKRSRFRKQKPKTDVPKGSTPRLQKLMRIWLRTGVKDFVFDPKKVVSGIFLATVNPMLVGLIVECIHQSESFSEIHKKRMYLFLVALAAGISCDSPVVRQPILLTAFFDNVIGLVSEGMQQGQCVFQREEVLPSHDFDDSFAVPAMQIFAYVWDQFNKVPDEVFPAEAEASSKKPAKQAAAKGGVLDPEHNEFADFDDEVFDGITMTTVASVDREEHRKGLGPRLTHVCDCFHLALELICQNKEITGNTSYHSFQFSILSLTSAALKLTAATAFNVFGKLCSMISHVGVKKFNISHKKSDDFISQLSCLVRLLLPAINQDDEQEAEIFLQCHLHSDENDTISFQHGASLSGLMKAVYGLFRHDLLDNKRVILDQQFRALFPGIELPVPVPVHADVDLHSSKAVRFATNHEGTEVVQLADLTREEFDLIMRRRAEGARDN